MSEPPSLKLGAQDQTDLTVLAACLQDALAPVSDIAYFPDERQMALAVNRFMWEHGGEDVGEDKLYYRTHALVRVENVSAVRSKGYERRDRARILSLMSLRPTETGIELVFADGAVVQIDADPLDVTLVDMGSPWPTRWRPDHPNE